MKKLAATITSIVVLIFFTTSSFAQTVNSSNAQSKTLGALSSISCNSQGDQDKVEMSVDSFKGYTVKRFDKPDRIVVDIPNTILTTKQKSISFKSKMVKSVRFSQFDKKTSRIVIDTIGKPQYQVVEKEGKLVLYIVNPIANGVAYYNYGNNVNFVFPGLKLIENNSSAKKLFTEKYEQSGMKYTITFPSNLGKLEDKVVKINDSFISTVQIVNNKSTKKTSIAFTAKDRFNYEAVAKDDVKGTSIIVAKDTLVDRAFENRGSEDSRSEEYLSEESETGVTEETNQETTPADVEDIVPVPSDSEENNSNTGASNNQVSGELLDIKHNMLSGSTNEVLVSLNSYTDYNIMRVTGSDRIVLDIPNTIAPASQKTINVGSSIVKDIRYAQYDNNVARIVIDTIGQPQYRVEERTGQLALYIESPTYKNISYNSSGDRVHFILNKAKLTEGGATLKKFYTESLDETGLIYTIMFETSKADVGYGTININDSLLSKVDIVKDQATGMTSITFVAKDKIVYNTITRPQTNDTAITVVRPFTSEDRVVVIDAGHGGVDPGAVQGSLKEKTLNLDIAIRLNNLLKSKGIKTYMTREDDSFVGLYERAYIANKLNGKLFLSIHNNAYYSSFKGTEVLYYSSGGFGKKFAQILQDALVSNLKTFDRKIKARPELVVLKATSMPSSLAEIAFMTNTDDRQKLTDENFRQKAAEALCEGIIKALGQME